MTEVTKFTANEALLAVLDQTSTLLGLPRPGGVLTIVRVDGNKLAYDFIPRIDWDANQNEQLAYRAHADALHRIPATLHCLREYGYQANVLAFKSVRVSDGKFQWQLVCPLRPNEPRLVNGKAIRSAEFGW